MRLEPVHLGHGIYFYGGIESEALGSLVGHARFLNSLWIPVALASLSADQIFVINRHRERLMASDPQFGHAQAARHALLKAISECREASIVELGCGKFPLAQDIELTEYLGIDIDAEAVSFVNDLGIRAVRTKDFLSSDYGSFGCAISIYTMHFAISDELLAALRRATDSFFCFNIIVADAVHTMALVARVSAHWQWVKVIKSPNMSRKEFFFVASDPPSAPRAEAFAAALSAHYSGATTPVSPPSSPI